MKEKLLFMKKVVVGAKIIPVNKEKDTIKIRKGDMNDSLFKKDYTKSKENIYHDDEHFSCFIII